MRIVRSGKRRRAFLCQSGAMASSVLLGAWDAGRVLADELSPTLACPDDTEQTRQQTEGPFFLPSSPQRRSLLEPGFHGTRIVLGGRVLSTRCIPVANALLDFWHADGDGTYDMEGFRMRGHQFTDSDGRYRLETIVPGLYPGRTRHFHVKVQAPHRTILTTQLYFPDEPRNGRDLLFDRRLLMTVDDRGDRKVARFDFVVKLA